MLQNFATHQTDDAIRDIWQTLASACVAGMPLFIALVSTLMACLQQWFGLNTCVTSYANHGQSQKVH